MCPAGQALLSLPAASWAYWRPCFETTNSFVVFHCFPFRSKFAPLNIFSLLNKVWAYIYALLSGFSFICASRTRILFTFGLIFLLHYAYYTLFSSRLGCPSWC